MNEAGLVASLLFLPESDYGTQGKRPVMGIAMWTQYVLDNFGTVSEAVGALRGDGIYIDAPDMPNGTKSRLHLAFRMRRATAPFWNTSTAGFGSMRAGSIG